MPDPHSPAPMHRTQTGPDYRLLTVYISSSWCDWYRDPRLRFARQGSWPGRVVDVAELLTFSVAFSFAPLPFILSSPPPSSPSHNEEIPPIKRARKSFLLFKNVATKILAHLSTPDLRPAFCHSQLLISLHLSHQGPALWY